MYLPHRPPRSRTAFVLCVTVAVVLTCAAVEAAFVRFAPPALVLGPAADSSSENGFPLSKALKDSAALEVVADGGWAAFDWYGEGIVFNREGPIRFTAAGPVTLRVTDDFCAGDRFRIYDNGTELERPTFDVEPSSSIGQDPSTAFADQRWSSGIYALEPGDHEIVVQVIENPWGMGRAHLRVDTGAPFGTFNLRSVTSNINPVHGLDRFGLTGNWTPAAGSDGVEPGLEDVVLWYGRYLEVLPAGSFMCNPTRCIYESTGPGITRAFVDATGFSFDAADVDLCPGQRWLPIGLWIGNEWAELSVRRHGILYTYNE